MRKNLSALVRVYSSDYDILQKCLIDAKKSYNTDKMEDEDDYDYVLELDGKRDSLINAAIQWVIEARKKIDGSVLGCCALFCKINAYIQGFVWPSWMTI